MKAAPTTAAELPPELAELEQLAAGADAAIAGVDQAAPGAPGQAPEVDKGDELGDMIALGMQMAGKVLPPVAKYFDREACREIGAAYIECAQKYGWTLHEKVGGPEVRLGAAIIIPGFLAFMETRAWLQWKREQAELEAKRTGETTPLPLVPAN